MNPLALIAGTLVGRMIDSGLVNTVQEQKQTIKRLRLRIDRLMEAYASAVELSERLQTDYDALFAECKEYEAVIKKLKLEIANRVVPVDENPYEEE